MATITVYQGNKRDIPVALQINGTLVTDLSDAIRIDVVLADWESRTAAIELNTADHPSQIEVDTPSTGYLTIHLYSTNTAIAPGLYDLAIQRQVDATNKEEWVEPKAVEIKADLID